MNPIGREKNMLSITELVNSVDGTNERALDELIVYTYEKLHASAKRTLGQVNDMPSVQATELVNELYLYFKKQNDLNCNDSAHFFAYAAMKLRHLLLDIYKKKSAKKRSFGEKADSEEINQVASKPPLLEMIIVNGYIEKLEEMDELAARVTDLLAFWEFNFAEVAEILDVSERTVYRKWKWALAWFGTQNNGGSISE